VGRFVRLAIVRVGKGGFGPCGRRVQREERDSGGHVEKEFEQV